MGNTSYSEPKPKTISEQFTEWINGLEVEQEEYTQGLHEIISECTARLEEEKPDETSRD